MDIDVKGDALEEAELKRLSDEIIDNLEDYYIVALWKVTAGLGIPNKSVFYSNIELAAAIDEAGIDLKALWTRRNPKKGLSRGKLAGLYCFRLARFKIIQMIDKVERPEDAFFQEIVALVFVLERILRVNANEKYILEMAYQLSRRHMNQETLAVTFDVIFDMTKKDGNE